MKLFNVITNGSNKRVFTLIETAELTTSPEVFEEISEMKVGKSIGLNNYTVVERIK